MLPLTVLTGYFVRVSSSMDLNYRSLNCLCVGYELQPHVVSSRELWSLVCHTFFIIPKFMLTVWFQLLDSCHTYIFRRTHRRSVVGHQKTMALYSETGWDKENDRGLILTLRFLSNCWFFLISGGVLPEASLNAVPNLYLSYVRFWSNPCYRVFVVCIFTV